MIGHPPRTTFALAFVILMATAAGFGHVSLAAEPTPQSGSAVAAAPAQMAPESIDDRIKALHDRLKIAPEQEPKWAKVAAIMRENAETIRKLHEERRANAAKMTAIDDLHSYQKIAEAHEVGNEKLTKAFEDLYGAMSADQKKNADDYFRFYGQHAREQ